MEFERIPRVGRVSISSTESGVPEPTMTETLRIGLSLRSFETITIQQGESVILATDLRLQSFRGGRIRSTRSVLGPGDKEEIRVHTSLLTREDHDTDIKFKLTNFGRDPWAVDQGDYAGQLIILGVDEVIFEDP
jgi:dUTPase